MDKRDMQKQSVANLRLVFFLNLGFTIIEFFGGLWTSSLAITADAVHDFGDSFAMGSAVYLEKLSGKKADEQYSYGYQRFSLLGAVITGVVLITGSVLILSRAIPKILNPQPAYAPGMIILAVAGLVVNGTGALKIKSGEGVNARVVLWHLLEDTLGWSAVLIISIVLLFTEFYIIDPLLSCIITGFVLFNVFRIMRKTAGVFLQKVPEGFNLASFKEEISRIPGVIEVNHIHIWALDEENYVMSGHLRIKKNSHKKDIIAIKNRAREIIRKYKVYHSTLEIEYTDEEYTDEPCSK
jgi:cobalt-zinc-cadmium efflux system protein